jgi:hypothetical protein
MSKLPEIAFLIQSLHKGKFNWTEDEWKLFLCNPEYFLQAITAISHVIYIAEDHCNNFVDFLIKCLAKTSIPTVNLIEKSRLVENGKDTFQNQKVLDFLLKCALKFEDIGLKDTIPRLNNRVAAIRPERITPFEVFYTDIQDCLKKFNQDLQEGRYTNDLKSALRVLSEIERRINQRQEFKRQLVEWQMLMELFLKHQSILFTLAQRVQGDIFEDFQATNTTIQTRLPSIGDLTYMTRYSMLPYQEGLTTEYKFYSFNRQAHKTIGILGEMAEENIKKTVSAFLNESGGRIFFGIRDNDQRVYG